MRGIWVQRRDVLFEISTLCTREVSISIYNFTSLISIQLPLCLRN